MDRLYDALETGLIKPDDLGPRIQNLRHRQDQLRATHAKVKENLRGRKREIPDIETLTSYVDDLRSLLNEGSLAEQKAFIKSFVQEIRVGSEDAVLRYTMPLPTSGDTEERTGVLSIVNDGGR